MKTSDYKELIRLLNLMADNAVNMNHSDSRGDTILLIYAANSVIESFGRIMTAVEDDWMETNQERADKGLKPTAVFTALYDAMCQFMKVTDKAIDGCGNIFDKTRIEVQRWIDYSVEWYPDPKPKLEVKLISKDKFRKLFNESFSRQDTEKGIVPVDEVYRFIKSNYRNYDEHDWGVICRQILYSSHRNTKMKMKPFKLLFDYFGVSYMTKHPVPNKYKNITDKTDLQDWLGVQKY